MSTRTAQVRELDGLFILYPHRVSGSDDQKRRLLLQRNYTRPKVDQDLGSRKRFAQGCRSSGRTRYGVLIYRPQVPISFTFRTISAELTWSGSSDQL
jgi:hypothetical protein